MIKADFHIHTKYDPIDTFVSLDPIVLMNRYHQKGFNLLSFTHHNSLVFEQGWAEYAKSVGIKLLPGVELTIERGHLLVVNAHKDVEKVKQIKDIQHYRTNHPESLIIIPHPHGLIPGKFGKRLEEVVEHADALELNAAMPFAAYYYQQTQEIAKKHKKPVIAGSDTHFASQIGTASNFIAAITWERAVQQIRDGNIVAEVTMPFARKYCAVLPRFAGATMQLLLQKV